MVTSLMALMGLGAGAGRKDSCGQPSTHAWLSFEGRNALGSRGINMQYMQMSLHAEEPAQSLATSESPSAAEICELIQKVRVLLDTAAPLPIRKQWCCD